ncbi:membrane protein [Gordonia phage NHagos]|nr:membrane protein [Gordonia phage NHagos]
MTVSLGYAIFVLVIYVLAVMRLVRLINFDTVLDGVRVAVVRVFGRESKAVYFIGCPWCVGFWVSLATAYLPVALTGLAWWWTFLIALATSHLVGAFAPLTADDDMEIEEVMVD